MTTVSWYLSCHWMTMCLKHRPLFGSCECMGCVLSQVVMCKMSDHWGTWRVWPRQLQVWIMEDSLMGHMVTAQRAAFQRPSQRTTWLWHLPPRHEWRKAILALVSVQVKPFTFFLSHYLLFPYGPLTAVSQARHAQPLANLKAYKTETSGSPSQLGDN